MKFTKKYVLIPIDDYERTFSGHQNEEPDIKRVSTQLDEPHQPTPLRDDKEGYLLDQHGFIAATSAGCT